MNAFRMPQQTFKFLERKPRKIMLKLEPPVRKPEKIVDVHILEETLAMLVLLHLKCF